jgi:hypothetical protein
MVMGLPVAPGGVTAAIVTLPVYDPTARLPAFAEICTGPGVVPVAGVAVSHVPPLSAAAVTVKLMALGVPETVTV